MAHCEISAGPAGGQGRKKKNWAVHIQWVVLVDKKLAAVGNSLVVWPMVSACKGDKAVQQHCDSIHEGGRKFSFWHFFFFTVKNVSSDCLSAAFLACSHSLCTASHVE